jgi:serine/threonine-protein phosphatase 2B catalytic subunit
MCHMLHKAGDPGKLKYLFLGDYVDRGIYSVEVVLLLMSLKLYFPTTVYLLRGNHESRNMTEHFTFREETLTKYDEEVFELFMEFFDSMPLAATIEQKYFVTHGGIGPELKKLEQINKINRFQETPLEGIFCDLLWADPAEDDKAASTTFQENDERECSYYFGKKSAKKLLDANKLMTIVRAH